MARFNGIPVEEEQKPKGPRFSGVPVDQQPEDDDGFSATEMVRNIPGSAVKMAKDLYQTVRHPIETAKGVGRMAAGGLYKANEAAKGVLPDFMTSPIYKDGEWFGEGDVFGKEQEPYADAAIDALKGRYGSGSAAVNTLEKDPVGALADLASVLSGTGAVTRSPRISNLAAAIDPVNVGFNAAAYTGGRVANLLPEKLSPVGLYEGAAKFGTTIPVDDRIAMTRTALDHRIMPSTAGVHRTQQLIGSLNNRLNDLINAAEEAGGTIPADAVFRHLGDLRRRKGGVRIDAPQNLEAIDRIVGDFRQHLSDIGKDQLTVADLQKLKVDAYERINWDARRNTGTPVGEDTFRTVARGAKDLIEQSVPGVRQTNQQLGRLYELQPHLQRSANRIENRDMISLGAPAKIGAGAMVEPTIGPVVGAISGVMDMPKPKAALAIQLNDLINNARLRRFIENNPNISRARLAAILSGRLTEENEQGNQ